MARESFGAWNSHNADGFVKHLDVKTTWEPDPFRELFTGHEGAAVR